VTGRGGPGSLVVAGGAVWNGTSCEPADVVVSGGAVVDVGAPGAATTASDGLDSLDATGCLVLPGLVDIHTHLREPGGEDAEDVASASAAAAAGGYCDLVAMPNTDPPQDTAAVVEAVRAAAARVGLVRVHPSGCVTRGRAGRELADLGELARAGVRVFTDDGSPVPDSKLMRRALEFVGALDGVVADHCEDLQLTDGAQMHEGEVSGRLGLRGWPAAAEAIVVARDILLAETTGSRVHLQHISTRQGVDLVRDAKARGVPVTAEVTTHHLTLTDEKASTFDPVYKVNPPLRSREHVEAVQAALADGTIDCVATDHAPHTPERKEEWTTAACGMLGLETALALVWALVEEGALSIGRLVDAMAVRPARIASLTPRGAVIGGSVADLVVFDPARRWEVDPRLLHSKGTNTPYAGMDLQGRVRHTVCGGRVTCRDGRVAEGVVV